MRIMGSAGWREREEGETLVEILIAVVFVGITVTALLAGMTTAISVSSVHRQQAKAEAVAREAAELLKDRDEVDESALVYNEDGVYAVPPVDGYATVVTTECWNPPPAEAHPASDSGSYGPCDPSNSDSRLQLLTVTVDSTKDERVSEAVQVVKRQLP